jgi:hypothetical protein
MLRPSINLGMIDGLLNRQWLANRIADDFLEKI